MPFPAQVIKVFIASPSDVPEERQIVREVVAEWNNVNAEHRGQVLLPIAWETHSTPSLAGRAQAIINEQVLANCDVLVAVFWTRLGQPTGGSVSGTAEEIDEHMKAGGKPMLYFSSKPVAPESVDPEQFKALLAFKKDCYGRGLVEDYDTLDDFRAKLTRHLSQTIIRDFPVTTWPALTAGGPMALEQPLIRDLLGTKAKELLLAATAAEDDGQIMAISSSIGLQVQTGRGVTLATTKTARDQASWRAAIQELLNHGLVDGYYQGEVFNLTAAGHEVAAELRSLQSNPPTN